jgi:hypothetical protein
MEAISRLWSSAKNRIMKPPPAVECQKAVQFQPAIFKRTVDEKVALAPSPFS